MNDKVCGYYLDKQQMDIVKDNSQNLLVVAGAGSGKTLTILGKINYLIKYKSIKPNEILCISFTKASSDSLRDKILSEFHVDIDVYTFHKLSLKLLEKSNKNYKIANSNTLEEIVNNFFHNTILSYPYHMKLVLSYFKQNICKNIKTDYIDFIDNNQIEINNLKKLIITFIHLFKCNNNDIHDFCKFLKRSRKNIFNYKRDKTLLTLILNVYIEYTQYLIDNNELDFDDMISKATLYVKNANDNYPFKYIIIDEYQDTSLVRFLLIKELLNKCKANLMVVGDDFQSIYRFTGCDLVLFTNFVKYFNNSKIMKIENTYRNSQELINVAGGFIMKNKKQIRKNLLSSKNISKPIKIVYYNNVKDAFTNLLLNIFDKTNKMIMVLGRNNYDIYTVINEDWVLKDNILTYKKRTNLKAYFYTIHKSKGLEEENVVIINLVNSKLGFPSKIVDDKILRFVLNDKESFPFAEERRLFYVALTRTKNNVYLLVPYKNASIFIEEIVKNYKKYIECINS